MTDSLRRLVVITGAGLSAESGLATFRDAGGIWSLHNLAEVCNYSVWRRNRAKVFDFYAKRKEEMLAASPNAAHRCLAQWQQQWGVDRVQLLTQNVDDLLERAGATNVGHLHGELSTLLCDHCYRKFDIGRGPVDPTLACPLCHEVAPVKPGVVMFGETSPGYHRLGDAIDGLEPEDILLVIGTSMQVIPVSRLVPAWRTGHALNWQVNPAPAEPGYFGWNLAASACDGLPQLEPMLSQLMSD
ncbi:Sir2 family NAD-dependent protein deacetylase [Paraburkholderia sp. A2RO-4L]|uniref:SIR2 family NAD-dependent protein deacylase n=1 Tax=Paraburkholderia sp. A2RO-4L TaxID=3028374 RepID=UPI0032F45754|nr:NAD-dependent deacetylase [Burkholderia vietnamiensis]